MLIFKKKKEFLYQLISQNYLYKNLNFHNYDLYLDK